MTSEDTGGPGAMRLDNPGDNPVDSQVVCVLTRFALKRSWDLILAYRDYKRVIAQAQSTGATGLLQTAFLVENFRTYCVLSIWSSYEAIPDFGTAVPVHIDAARKVFARLKFDPEHGPEAWSTKWNIRSVSNNLHWADFDLRSWLIAHPGQRTSDAEELGRRAMSR